MSRTAEPSELELHIRTVHHLRTYCAPEWLFFHCPNGEVRDPRLGAKLNAMGLRKGIPTWSWSIRTA